MPRYTGVYSAFILRLIEVTELRKLARSYERKGLGERDKVNALCRGAIVLLLSHVEAFIKELGELTLDSVYEKDVSRGKMSPRLFFHISKDILDEIKDTSDGEKIAVKVFEFINSDSNYWSNTGPFPESISSERFNKGFANPSFDKINSYFGRFGYTTYKPELKSRLKSNYNAYTNMVNYLVEIRNKIAHGDLEATKTPTDVKEMVK